MRSGPTLHNLLKSLGLMLRNMYGNRQQEVVMVEDSRMVVTFISFVGKSAGCKNSADIGKQDSCA